MLADLCLVCSCEIRAPTVDFGMSIAFTTTGAELWVCAFSGQLGNHPCWCYVWPPRSIISGVQNVAAKIDPLLPTTAFHTIEDLPAESLKSQRFEATLLATLSALALLLAVVGIYGLMAR